MTSEWADCGAWSYVLKSWWWFGKGRVWDLAPLGTWRFTVLRWMCDSPRTGCARRTTPICTWREQAIIEWSRRMISIVACCHSAKLCALATRSFRSQQKGVVTRIGTRRGEWALYRVDKPQRLAAGLSTSKEAFTCLRVYLRVAPCLCLCFLSGEHADQPIVQSARLLLICRRVSCTAIATIMLRCRWCITRFFKSVRHCAKQ